MNHFTRRQKRVLLVSILASFVAGLDGFIVNVALPAIELDLGGGLTAQQWIVNAYLLTLGALMLLAGTLSDTFGRMRILTLGLIGFGVTSLLCAIAPGSEFLIVMRGVQGAAGALLVPSSLALIMANFSGPDEGDAIGRWTAWTVVSAVIGPLLGGLLVDAGSWRLIFWINLLPIAVTLWLLRSLGTDPREAGASRIDATGAALAAGGLGLIMWALIEEPNRGWERATIYLPFFLGLVTLAVFVWYEGRIARPMLPMGLFAVRNFGMGNLATLFIYGGLSVASFLIIIYLQQIAGYSALAAGLTFLPVTILMFALSSYFGRLAGRHGPRLFMSLGPIVAGAGFLLLLGMDKTVAYWTDLLPGLLIFGVGLAMTVAPLTTAILTAIGKQQSWIASAINNSVARLAGLVTIALIGIVVGEELTVAGFRAGMLFTAVLLFAGGIVSWVGIRTPRVAGSPALQSSP